MTEGVFKETPAENFLSTIPYLSHPLTLHTISVITNGKNLFQSKVMNDIYLLSATLLSSQNANAAKLMKTNRTNVAALIMRIMVVTEIGIFRTSFLIMTVIVHIFSKRLFSPLLLATSQEAQACIMIKSQVVV